jgi:hypothetical protein
VGWTEQHKWGAVQIAVRWAGVRSEAARASQFVFLDAALVVGEAAALETLLRGVQLHRGEDDQVSE